MSIEVEGPDGAIHEFPDNTSQDVMKGALARHYGPPRKPTRLQIDGVGTVEVGDEFNSMSPDDQNAVVSHIAGQIGKGVRSGLPTSMAGPPAPSEPSIAEDIGKSAISGVGTGAANTCRLARRSPEDRSAFGGFVWQPDS